MPLVEVEWPVCVGSIPELASAFQPRAGLRDSVLNARRDGADVVLAQPEVTVRETHILAGGGGVGKSQLAAWFAGQALTDPGVDLLVWVPADSPEQIIAAYARTARRIGLPGADGADPAADAKALLEWLRTATRRWLIVLDDITDPADVKGWWPPTCRRGWTLATTRLHDATLHSSGRRQVDVGVYARDESVAYLAARLTEAGAAHLLDGQAPMLAAAVGDLPLALSHAAAFMINQQESCTEYLARFRGGRQRLVELMPAEADPDGYGRPAAVTLLLTLQAVERTDPSGLARPVLTLVSLLDPAGHPEALWVTDEVLAYLTATRSGVDLPHPVGSQEPASDPVTADQARRVLRVLHRYALIAHDGRDRMRSVRIHALTARAVRETASDPVSAARAAADALLALWPEQDHAITDLTTVLHANTTALHNTAGGILWKPAGHSLLYRAGNYLGRAGLYATAVTYWTHMIDQAQRLLGPEHRDALSAQASLAASYGQAGRTGEAIELKERVLADHVRLLGPEHPATLTARANLVVSYWQAGRTGEAIEFGERVLADRVRLLGPEHLSTLTARSNLAASYRQAGRTGEAIEFGERVLADRVRLLGPEHPATLTARANLAASYGQAGRTGEAIELKERVLADHERLLGPEHPATLMARSNLVASYWQAGRTGEAIEFGERVLADRVRLLGLEHPDTLSAGSNLAASYQQAGRTGEAIEFGERVLADRVRLQGLEHPDTLTARANLAASYQQAGRTGEAIVLQERVLADRERLLGPEHPATLRSRANLASSYWETGRKSEAIEFLEQALTGRKRSLGLEHPDTRTSSALLRRWIASA